jgi:Putative zinc-finger
MSAEPLPACTLGLTPTTLSAWRDHTLSAAEAEQFRAHVARCSACRERLADYEAIANTLRAQRAPAPDERLWRGVRAGMAQSRRRAPFNLPVNVPCAQSWRTLAAAAAVLLLATGFAQLLRYMAFGRATGGPVPVATATSARVSPLVWLPAPQQTAFGSAGLTPANLAIAPSDGNTAYACIISSSGQGLWLAVWVTHDRAAHWAPTASQPNTHPIDANSHCSLSADAVDAQTAVVVVDAQSPRQGPNLAAVSTFVTTNGGASWRQLTGPEPFTIVDEHFTVGASPLATGLGVSYALRYTEPKPGTTAISLSASSDGMRTWRSIDQTITAAGQQVVAFWVNPSTGEILAEGAGQANAPMPPDRLWTSRDGGQHWTHLNGPSLITSGQFVVQAPSSNRPWHICYLYQAQADHPAHANQLLCSTDGGQTWVDRPTLNFTFTCYKCAAGGTPTTEVFDMTLIAISGDGAALATVEVPQAPVTVPSSGGPPPVLTLYRLPPGGNVWQSLGALPHGIDAQTGELVFGNVVYVAHPGRGLLWSVGTDRSILTAAYP